MGDVIDLFGKDAANEGDTIFGEVTWRTIPAKITGTLIRVEKLGLCISFVLGVKLGEGQEINLIIDLPFTQENIGTAMMYLLTMYDCPTWDDLTGTTVDIKVSADSITRNSIEDLGNASKQQWIRKLWSR